MSTFQSVTVGIHSILRDGRSSRVSLLPFTVTRSITIQEFSIAVGSRDANYVFEKITREQLELFDLCPLIADDSRLGT